MPPVPAWVCAADGGRPARRRKQLAHGSTLPGPSMTSVTGEAPRVLHSLPGRLRVHVANGEGNGQQRLERRLRRIPGVQSVQWNDITGNALIRFDPHTSDAPAIVDAIVRLRAETNGDVD